MCGISGYIDLHQRTAPQELLRITEVIRHRGPDGEGYALFAENGEVRSCYGPDTNEEIRSFASRYQPEADIRTLEGTYQVGFGHRRLSILDLSPRGHMPMCDETKQYWMTYNGEVYNYSELKEELQKLGHHFNTEGDSEVVLKSFIQWGPDCLHKFMGMFAIAIYNTANQMLFLARDRFGIKPLYYYTSSSGVFYFGSEIKQFTATTSFLRRLNKQMAYDYLFYSLTDHTPETFFEDTYHLPASHYYFGKIDSLGKRDQKLNTTQWYNLKESKVELSFKEACDQFRGLFEQAVRQHLRSDVPLAAALSGGLDSTSIVCQSQKILNEQGLGNNLETYSSVAVDERFSEKKWIDEVVKFTGLKANFVYPGPERLVELNDKMLWQMDEPYQSQSAYLGYHVFEAAAKQGIKVLLNGQGADEYLSGYQEFRNVRLKKELLRGNLGFVQMEIGSSNRTKVENFKVLLKLVLSNALSKGARQEATKKTSEYLQLKSVLSGEWLEFLREVKHPLSKIKYSTNSHFNCAKLQLFHTSLPKYLRWEDRNSMANSIEARVPFLDHRLVEFSLSLPIEYLTWNRETPKPLLTEGLKALLPPTITQRKDKMGFITPEQLWVKSNSSNSLFQDFQEKVSSSSFFNLEKVEAYLKNLRSGKQEFNYSYWRIISLVNFGHLNAIHD